MVTDEEIERQNREDAELYDAGEYHATKKPFTDDMAWVAMSRADWRFLSGNEYKAMSELTYQQFYKLKLKKDPRYHSGIKQLAHDIGIGRAACTNAINSLESKWGLISVERRGNSAWVIAVLRAPSYHLPREFPVPELSPRERTEAPDIDPLTGEILPREPGKRCAGITITGQRCKRNTRVGDYCARHHSQDPCIESMQPLVSPQYIGAIDPCIKTEPGVPIVREIVRDSREGSASQPFNASESQIAPHEISAQEFLSEHPELDDLDPPATFEQRAEIVALQRQLGLTRAELIDRLDILGYSEESPYSVSESQAAELIAALSAEILPEPSPPTVEPEPIVIPRRPTIGAYRRKSELVGANV
jgi:biotin operon repressor